MSENTKEKLNIICLSNQLWDFENWTNKKHVMSRLMKAGNSVLFVDPPINTGRVLLRHILRRNWDLKRILTQVKNTSSKSLIFTPLNVIPFTSVTSFFHALKIRRLQKRMYKDKSIKTILWIYNVEIPHLKNYLKFIKYDLLVYDCVDNYPGFPRYNTPEKRKKIADIEEYLSKKADIVFTTAPGLFTKLKKFNTNTHYTPNVGDYEKFKDTQKYRFQLPDDLKEISSPRIGFIGALDEYKFDFKLLRKVALDYPDFSFVLIGPLGLKDKNASINDLGLSDLSNVYYLGPRPYDKKINYMAGFDVDIIPYVLNDYTVGGCFPVKFHDSLAAGLPVVVTDLPAYKPFNNVCYISKDYDEFSKNIKKALKENNLDRVKKRKAVAKDNSWENKVCYMLSLIYEKLKI